MAVLVEQNGAVSGLACSPAPSASQTVTSRVTLTPQSRRLRMIQRPRPCPRLHQSQTDYQPTMPAHEYAPHRLDACACRQLLLLGSCIARLAAPDPSEAGLVLKITLSGSLGWGRARAL